MDYHRILKEKLSEKRYLHSLAVSDEAGRLARRYGADVQKAELCGLLHDVMKDASIDAQLQIISDSGILLSNVEQSAKKLLHAIAGAVYVRDRLGISDPQVFDAVRYHTTGRAGMYLLERVLFVADFISRDRDYEGVEMIRALSDQTLEAAMEEGLAFTITELAAKRMPIHPDTLEAYNELTVRL